MNTETNGVYSPDSDDPIVLLAWRAVEAFTCGDRLPPKCELPADFPDRAGCFVSIHNRYTHDLRGCMGTIEPTEPTLCEEVIRNSVVAASNDPRFPPIKVSELESLEINVDVLYPAEPAEFEELDPKRYGVIVTQGYRRGLLLPDLEGVDSAKEQVEIACRKAGIDPRSDFALERFEVERHV